MPEDQFPHQVQNGYLGWHYVNRIDTTIYISGAYNFAPGSHTIIWDGYGNENTSGGYGGTYKKNDHVKPGTYDYYVWGYDNQSPRERVCNFLPISFYSQPQYTKFGEWDEQGLPRPNPLIWGNIPWMYDNLHGVGPPRWTAFKLPLGTDPVDVSKLQTTFMPGFSEEEQYDASPISFDPFDQNYFYCTHVYTTQKKGELHKWKWVGDGDAEIVEEWGERDDLLLKLASRSGMGEYMPAVTNDTRFIYIASPGRNPYEFQHDVLYIISFDGEKFIEGQMLDDFYTPDAWADIYTNGTVNRMFAHRDHPYWLVVGGEQHCMMEMIDCDRLIADEGDDEYVMWKNGNGDYFLDGSWNPEISTHPWQCNTGEYTNENMGRHNEQFFDSEGIVIAFADYQGLYSFVVCTQDGSGVAYCKFADDTNVSNTNRKGSGQRVDIGSQFDGLYVSDVVSDELNYGSTTQHINWVAFDSAHGIIDYGRGDYFIHTISKPETPYGPLSGTKNESFTYRTDGAVCHWGHPVEYQFDYGEGTFSPWSSNRNVTLTFTYSGTHNIRVQARCTKDTSILSEWSEPLIVFIENLPCHYQLTVSNTSYHAAIHIITPNIPKINDEPIVIGDCIGVFTPGGLCAGAGVWEGENLSITVWGDDPDTANTIEGIQSGEEYLFKIWQKDTDTEYSATATYFTGSSKFEPDAIVVLESLIGKDAASTVDDLDMPTKFILSQNSPNPFNPTTTIEYAIPAGKSEHVRLNVYDLRGALVKTLVDEISSPGIHSVVWDGTDDNGNKVSSGVYIYRLQSAKLTKARKMLLLR